MIDANAVLRFVKSETCKENWMFSLTRNVVSDQLLPHRTLYGSPTTAYHAQVISLYASAAASSVVAHSLIIIISKKRND